ncbi:U32 family peptidase [Gilliamella sp. B14384H2]|uniref:peptidase U32 family protein n=1 Tax=unclassified Gilliamella TaxID=2685620 RepID=UPI0018DC2A01|nr:U32 family peptidase [Gilliamella sp. B14384G10]MBI0039642.1 U32 family peptidase [Gilliamella sp. B14384G7]MBI0051482.1 U32 family peptidase [Gilliamella sp. B14384G13]MBI0053934.1 U32 family peptidase [Gilliamella sp. B14384H2]
MQTNNNKLELLSPAKNIDIAKQAILHGADAVYIGGPHFGARHNAGNSVSDIAELVEFAHRFYAKVFVTLNTILHDNELEMAQQLIWQLYDAGVDALIVQDMGILAMDIPPIDLHASTQMDIRTPEKAKFLSDVGFSQIVLARELNLTEIANIHQQIDANIEFFIHGALCVAFSGQCYISHAQTGRSANRGDCSQACRLPFTLKDDQGRVVAYEKHLLSMKDNNQSENLIELIQAGVRSFKIEGRYKDLSYVKNITAFYRKKLDEILEKSDDFVSASSGRTQHSFTPDPNKTFHRGATDYFVRGRQSNIGAFDSPKFIGLPIGEMTKVTNQAIDIKSEKVLTNGDGLNVMVKREIVGFRADKVEKIANNHYRVFPNELPKVFHSLKLPYQINRNLDHNWQQVLLKESSNRRIGVAFELINQSNVVQLIATSEEGCRVKIALKGEFELAEQSDKALKNIKDSLSKLGQTIYYLTDLEVNLTEIFFIPSSQLNQLRRDIIDKLTLERLTHYQRKLRKPQTEPSPIYPEEHLSFLANIYNHKAREFYAQHGVKLIESAFEAHEVKDDAPLMITKHCLRFAFNLCPKQAKGIQGVKTKVTPMKLVQNNNEELILKFNCKACEMQVWGKIKNHILKMPLPGSELILLTNK